MLPATGMRKVRLPLKTQAATELGWPICGSGPLLTTSD